MSHSTKRAWSTAVGWTPPSGNRKKETAMENTKEEFIRQIRVERGLSPNTQTTYGYQLALYLKFLQAQGKTPIDATREDVLAYLDARHAEKLKPSSMFATAIALQQF